LREARLRLCREDLLPALHPGTGIQHRALASQLTRAAAHALSVRLRAHRVSTLSSRSMKTEGGGGQRDALAHEADGVIAAIMDRHTHHRHEDGGAEGADARR
jgi:hypothetical protein